MKRYMVFVLPLLLLATALFAATPGTVSVIDYEEASTFWFLDPMNNPKPWTCSVDVPPERCYANSSSGDIYIVNGVRMVDPKLSNNKIYYYVQLYAKGNSSTAGPAWQYQDASFVVMTAPRTWQGMRGIGLVLETDTVRPDNPEDFREWTVGHAIYDANPQKFFVTATNPQNGGNYIDGFVVVGTSADGIHDFNWRNVFKFEQKYHIRMLGFFFYLDAGSCSGQNCQYSGVLTWSDDTTGLAGTTPIRYRPCFSGCSNQGAIDIRIDGQGWRTFTIASNNTYGVNLGAQGLKPERTIAGRTMGYTTATYGGVTQYELWRSAHATLTPFSWAPCDPNSEPYKTNRKAWSANTGAKLQYRRYDPVAGAPVDNVWIDFESPTRTITPTHYNKWSTWIIGRIDYGQTNMLYLAGRDNHICQDGNDWDTGTGKGIQYIQLGESLGTNQ